MAQAGEVRALAEAMHRLVVEAQGLPLADALQAAAMVVGMILAAGLRDGPSREVAVRRLAEVALAHAAARAPPRGGAP